jgi:hypothetical protein
MRSHLRKHRAALCALASCCWVLIALHAALRQEVISARSKKALFVASPRTTSIWALIYKPLNVKKRGKGDKWLRTSRQNVGFATVTCRPARVVFSHSLVSPLYLRIIQLRTLVSQHKRHLFRHVILLFTLLPLS